MGHGSNIRMMGHLWRGVALSLVLFWAGEAWADASSGCQILTWDAFNEQALPYCLEAAQKGDAYAQNIMGVSQTLEAATAQDAAKAVNWFRKAAAHGFAPAQNNLAVAYATGFGVKQNDSKATDWWRQAAVQGDPDARVSLGLSRTSDQGKACSKLLAEHFFYRAGIRHINDYNPDKAGECALALQQLDLAKGDEAMADRLIAHINDATGHIESTRPDDVKAQKSIRKCEVQSCNYK